MNLHGRSQSSHGLLYTCVSCDVQRLECSCFFLSHFMSGSLVIVSRVTCKKMWLQLFKDFKCTVTSTWVDADDRGECHT